LENTHIGSQTFARGPASSYRSGRVAEIPLTEAMIDLQLVADSLIIETF
jgi:hypothetical protein